MRTFILAVFLTAAAQAAVTPPATTVFTRGLLKTTNSTEALTYLGAAAGGGSTVTNYVRMPYTTLTYSGTNLSSLDFAAASIWKVTLTNDAFVGAPANLPGTSLNQTAQLFVLQDGTGGRALTFTNSAWTFNGSGTSTNAVPSLVTNANALTVITFTTRPDSATKVAAIVSTIGP